MTLADEIREVLKEQRDFPIIVWYDEDGSLQDIIESALQKGMRFIRYEGSYLRIRFDIEEKDPEFRDRWLVYIPEKRYEPSWILDYELFGKTLYVGLKELLSERLGLSIDMELDNLLIGERARELAKNWDQFVGTKKISKDIIEEALLSLAFGEPVPITEAVLRYVISDKPEKELERLGLKDLFIKRIRSELHLEIKELSRERIASAILFSDLASSDVGKERFSNFLPLDDRINVWAGICKDWVARDEKSFKEWSKDIAVKYDVESELRDAEDITDIMSFSVVDELLLERTRTMASNIETFRKNLDRITRIAEKREKSPWATKDEINRWEVIKRSAELLRQAQKALSSIDSYTESADSIVSFYTKEGCDMDSLARGLIKYEKSEDFFTFVKPALAIYIQWLSDLTERFSSCVEKLPEWRIGQLINQSEFWEIFTRDKPIAIFFIDALRYDLGKDLKRRLEDEGFEVELRGMLSSLPSITEVGMSALLPHASMEIRLENGKPSVLLDGMRVNKNVRRDILKKHGAAVIELGELQKRSFVEKIKDTDYIVVIDRNIDAAGHMSTLDVFMSDPFDEVIKKTARGIKALHSVGVERIIVATDHGFLLLPEEYGVKTISGVRPSEALIVERRYAIGRTPRIPSLISFPLDWAGLKGEGSLSFPRGLFFLALQGEPQRFIHGGISPQENCIPVLISRMRESAAKKLDIEAEIPHEITGMIFSVEVRPAQTSRQSKKRKVVIEVYSNEEKIGGSDVGEVSAESARFVVKLKRSLDEIKQEEVEVKVVDAESSEVLKSERVKISSMYLGF